MLQPAENDGRRKALDVNHSLVTDRGFLIGMTSLFSELMAATCGNPSYDFDALSKLPPRERVFALERLIAASGCAFPGALLSVKHFISGGLYARELFIPKGIVATGYIHRHDHIAMSNGDVSVYDEAGLQRLTGFNVFTSKAGIKRAAYAHKDSIFTTITKMSDPRETDTAKLEREFMTDSFEEFDQHLLTGGCS